MKADARRRFAPRAAIALALLAASCASLEKDPESLTARGRQRIALLAGTTLQEAELSLDGKEGPLTGAYADADPTLSSELDFQLEYSYFLRDDIAVGLAAGARRYDPSAERYFGAELDPDIFWTTQWSAIGRYYLGAFGAERRWRPLVGADLINAPEIDWEATVDYGGGATERVHFEGDSYLALALRAGIAAVLSDDLWLELGTAYEFPLDASEDNITIDPPGAESSKLAADFSPTGFVFYLGLAYAF